LDIEFQKILNMTPTHCVDHCASYIKEVKNLADCWRNVYVFKIYNYVFSS
jgi:hypothetical protein